MDRYKAAVVFGGQSSEHIVSCMSAVNVIRQIDRDRYDVLLIGITQEGRWLLTDGVEQIQDGSWREGDTTAVILPDATEKAVFICGPQGSRKVKLDVVFPVLHGLYGEDGTIQGLLEMARIPYVGCGVLASAVAMDKLSTKIAAGALGIRQADYQRVDREELSSMESVIRRIEEHFSYPVFVKPSNAGSSRGVSKAENREQLEAGLREAAHHDRKILVEEMIQGREIECAVFGGGGKTPVASGVGEILSAAEFYDFDAKYFNQESKTITDPVLPAGAEEQIRSQAVKIFQALDGYGLARVDFFVKEDGTVIFNEINTMPGFTAISMYPMLWEARGISKKELVNQLIEHGMRRFD